MSWNYTSKRLKSSLDNIANLKKLGKDFWVVLDLNENTPPRNAQTRYVFFKGELLKSKSILLFFRYRRIFFSTDLSLIFRWSDTRV